MFDPLKPVSRGARFVLGAGFFVLFFAAWALATFGGMIDPMFLKDPWYTLTTGWSLFTEYGFVSNKNIQLVVTGIGADGVVLLRFFDSNTNEFKKVEMPAICFVKVE